MDSFVLGKTKILCFSTFESSCKINVQNYSGESIENHGDSMVAHPKLILDNDACGLTLHSPTEEIHIGTTTTTTS